MRPAPARPSPRRHKTRHPTPGSPPPNSHSPTTDRDPTETGRDTREAPRQAPRPISTHTKRPRTPGPRPISPPRQPTTGGHVATRAIAEFLTVSGPSPDTPHCHDARTHSPAPLLRPTPAPACTCRSGRSQTPSARPRPPTGTGSVHRPSSTARTAPPDPTFELLPAPGAGMSSCPASSYAVPNLTIVPGPSGSPLRPSPSRQRVSRVLVERQSCASGAGQSG